jgi:hypothetical protein
MTYTLEFPNEKYLKDKDKELIELKCKLDKNTWNLLLE